MARKHLLPKILNVTNWVTQKIIGFILSLLLLSNCTEDRVFDRSISMGEIGWLQKNTLDFPFQIQDTTLLYDLQVAVRQSNEYPFYNLYFVPQIEREDGKPFKRGMAEAFFYDAKTGKAKGSGLGDIYSHRYVIFHGLKFNKSGKYRVKLAQFMRTDTLKGIVSVGASLIKSRQ